MGERSKFCYNGKKVARLGLKGLVLDVEGTTFHQVAVPVALAAAKTRSNLKPEEEKV